MWSISKVKLKLLHIKLRTKANITTKRNTSPVCKSCGPKTLNCGPKNTLLTPKNSHILERESDLIYSKSFFG